MCHKEAQSRGYNHHNSQKPEEDLVDQLTLQKHVTDLLSAAGMLLACQIALAYPSQSKPL